MSSDDNNREDCYVSDRAKDHEDGDNSMLVLKSDIALVVIVLMIMKMVKIVWWC